MIWILDEIALLHRTDESEALESAKHKKILEVQNLVSHGNRKVLLFSLEKQSQIDKLKPSNRQRERSFWQQGKIRLTCNYIIESILTNPQVHVSLSPSNYHSSKKLTSILFPVSSFPTNLRPDSSKISINSGFTCTMRWTQYHTMSNIHLEEKQCLLTSFFPTKTRLQN